MGAVEALFDKFDHFLKDKGYQTMGGQIIDVTIVSAAQQHNNYDENDKLKNGETPTEWKPAKRRQKDRDARWTQKHNRSYFGYKNHVTIDWRYKFIRRYAVSDTSIHDSQKLNDFLDMENASADIWADSAY